MSLPLIDRWCDGKWQRIFEADEDHGGNLLDDFCRSCGYTVLSVRNAHLVFVRRSGSSRTLRVRSHITSSRRVIVTYTLQGFPGFMGIDVTFTEMDDGRLNVTFRYRSPIARFFDRRKVAREFVMEGMMSLLNFMITH